MNPLPPLLLAAGLAFTASGHAQAAPQAPTALAPSTAPVNLDAQTTELVQRLVLDRAASLAKAQRKANEREQDLLDRLENKDRQLRRALASEQAGSSRAAQLRAELISVTAERERLVAELSQRDQSFREELAQYRRLVAEMAHQATPERRAALERYANGDRVGAIATLRELTRIEEEAGELAVKQQAAARYREQADLADEIERRRDR